MNTAVLEEFFGWCLCINVVILALTTLILILFQYHIAKIHSAMFNINEQELPGLYMHYLANYKIAAFIFSFVPYVALKMMAI